MKTLFLKLKHWQLFILHFALPMVIYLITVIGFVAKMMTLKNPNDFNPSMMSGLFIGVIILVMVSHGTVTIWNWTIGTTLIEQIPKEIHLKNRFFKFTSIFPFIYLTVMLIVMSQFIQTIDFNSHQPPNFNPLLLLLIIPGHIFMLFCSFYNIYFTSKTIKTALLKREVTFGDYVGEFFMIMFFFIGIWIIQPKVNDLIEPKSDF